MAIARMTLDGVPELNFALRRFPRQAKEAVAAGEYNAMGEVMLDAKGRAPYEFGDLESGAYLTRPEYSAKSVVVEGGFGGPASAYMTRQHEDDSYNHPGLKSRSPNMARASKGEVKFFEKAMMKGKDRIRRVIASAVEQFLRTGSVPSLVKKVPITPGGA